MTMFSAHYGYKAPFMSQDGHHAFVDTFRDLTSYQRQEGTVEVSGILEVLDVKKNSSSVEFVLGVRESWVIPDGYSHLMVHVMMDSDDASVRDLANSLKKGDAVSYSGIANEGAGGRLYIADGCIVNLEEEDK